MSVGKGSLAARGVMFVGLYPTDAARSSSLAVNWKLFQLEIEIRRVSPVKIQTTWLEAVCHSLDVGAVCYILEQFVTSWIEQPVTYWSSFSLDPFGP